MFWIAPPGARQHGLARLLLKLSSYHCFGPRFLESPPARSCSASPKTQLLSMSWIAHWPVPSLEPAGAFARLLRKVSFYQCFGSRLGQSLGRAGGALLGVSEESAHITALDHASWNLPRTVVLCFSEKSAFINVLDRASAFSPRASRRSLARPLRKVSFYHCFGLRLLELPRTVVLGFSEKSAFITVLDRGSASSSARGGGADGGRRAVPAAHDRGHARGKI